MFVHKLFLFQGLSVSWLYGRHRNKNPVASKGGSYDSNNNFDQDSNYIQASQSSLSFSNNNDKQIINEDFCDVNTR
jgi:hypothetical protein